MDTEVRNAFDVYLKRLLKYIGFKKFPKYTQLMEDLLSIDFEWADSTRMDYNRAVDGLVLREHLCSNVSDLSDQCSVLEMLCAMAIRIEVEYLDEDASTHDIFWEMLVNLGLEEFYDSNYDSHEVYYIIERWMYRQFDYNGSGSIFPLNEPRRDQRKIEIWAQMNDYITENY